MRTFSKTGTFKIRGALTRLLTLSEKEIEKGIITGSGGNHGISLAYASKLKKIKTKIVIPKTMNPLRYKKIKDLNVDIIETDNIVQVMEKTAEISKTENLVEISGFNHPSTTLGQASLGLEFLKQVPDLDSIIVSIGGGGLSSGVSCAAKLINPNIKVYGVEPKGADSMYQSFKIGYPYKLPTSPNTIADSLSAPYAGDYSYSICKKYIDEIVLVSDDEIRHAMKILAEELNLICEPACAAATAALIGPLKEKTKGTKVGVILCGSNIDLITFYKILFN